MVRVEQGQLSFTSRCPWKFLLPGEEIAQATRGYFERDHPKKRAEWVETLMHVNGWELIWTLPNISSFQPIELFKQHGKRTVTFHYEAKNTMKEGRKGRREEGGNEGYEQIGARSKFPTVS